MQPTKRSLTRKNKKQKTKNKKKNQKKEEEEEEDINIRSWSSVWLYVCVVCCVFVCTFCAPIKKKSTLSTPCVWSFHAFLSKYLLKKEKYMYKIIIIIIIN